MGDLTDEQALTMFGAAGHMANQDKNIIELRQRIEELEAKLEEAVVTRRAVHERIRADERNRCLSVAPPILVEGSNERLIGYSQGVMDYQDAIRKLIKLMEMGDASGQ